MQTQSGAIRRSQGEERHLNVDGASNKADDEGADGQRPADDTLGGGIAHEGTEQADLWADGGERRKESHQEVNTKR